jgi:hypothetical protein
MFGQVVPTAPLQVDGTLFAKLDSHVEQSSPCEEDCAAFCAAALTPSMQLSPSNVVQSPLSRCPLFCTLAVQFWMKKTHPVY